MELYATASRYPLVSKSCLFQDMSGRYVTAAAAGLPPEVVTAAQERGRVRDLETVVSDLLIELQIP